MKTENDRAFGDTGIFFVTVLTGSMLESDIYEQDEKSRLSPE